MALDKKEVLTESASEIFETMIFMEVTPYLEDRSPEINSGVLSSISFSGQYNGTLTIICSEECAKIITMNVLAIDDESEMEEFDIPDAMGEVANMCMGSVKARMLEEMGELSVTVPNVVSGSNMVPKMCEGGQLEQVNLMVDYQYPMTLNFTYYSPKKEESG